jgi:hypothetical protein
LSGLILGDLKQETKLDFNADKNTKSFRMMWLRHNSGGCFWAQQNLFNEEWVVDVQPKSAVQMNSAQMNFSVVCGDPRSCAQKNSSIECGSPSYCTTEGFSPLYVEPHDHVLQTIISLLNHVEHHHIAQMNFSIVCGAPSCTQLKWSQLNACSFDTIYLHSSFF